MALVKTKRYKDALSLLKKCSGFTDSPPGATAAVLLRLASGESEQAEALMFEYFSNFGMNTYLYNDFVRLQSSLDTDGHTHSDMT